MAAGEMSAQQHAQMARRVLANYLAMDSLVSGQPVLPMPLE